MRIEHIRLRNFRGFTDFEVDLHPHMTVLVGENGAGKTSLIDALTYAIAATIEQIVSESVPPVAEDIRREAYEDSGVVDLQPQPPMTMDWRVSWGGETHALQASTGGMHWTTNKGDWTRVRQHSNDIREMLKSGTAPDLPIVLRIPSSRQWSHQIQVGEDWEGQRQKGYKSWAAPSANQQQTVAWLRHQTYVELQEGPGAAPQLAAVKLAIRNLVPRLMKLEYRVREHELRFTMKGGGVVAFHELSDGVRNMVATAADIAYRAAVLNPQLGADAARDTEGIVLVDEVDLHLHPKWQREVLSSYRRVFPKIQFVVTTHSPQVLAGAKREWVRLLEGDRATSPGHVEGRDSNSLLEDVFDVDGRPAEHRHKIEQLFKLIDDEKHKDARAAIDELRETLGPDDPELTRAQWLLDTEEG